MPSDAAKKARSCEMKWRSLSVRRFQFVVSVLRSISSAVQNEASAFLYIRQMSSCWMGKEQNGGGLLEEAVRGQGILRFRQSCALMMG